jgi:hypothetical protein
VRWSPEYIFKRRHLSSSYTQFADSSKLYTNSKSSWEFTMGTNVRLGIYDMVFYVGTVENQNSYVSPQKICLM